MSNTTADALLSLIRKRRITPDRLCVIFGLDPQHHATHKKVVDKLVRKKYDLDKAAVHIEQAAANL